MNVILTGMMGSGKSAVGQELARELKFGYIDMDEMIAEQVGVTINEIFKKKGEEYFRKKEWEAVHLLCLMDSHVFATGGGVILNPDNIKNFRENGKVIYLSADPETLWNRLKIHEDRPLLKVADPLGKLKEILSKREALYKECDKEIKTVDKNIKVIVEEIIEFIKHEKV